MSFFIKGKQSNGVLKRTKYSKENTKKRKVKESSKDVEITSSEDEFEKDEISNQSSSEDENETAQDKKLRLAKVYLEEIEKQEKARLENKEIDTDIIAKRIKDDYLKETGRFRTKVADSYKGYDTSNIKVLKCREHNNSITCLCISSDDKFIFSGSKDGSIVKWSLEEHKKVGSIPFIKSNAEAIIGHCHKILCIAISTDFKFLVIGDESKDIQIWDPVTLKHINVLKGHRNSVTGVTFKRETHTLYSCSKDRSIKVWSLDEMAYVETLYGHQDMITSIDTLFRDRVITSGGRDGTVRIWKITEESQLIYNGHSGSIDVVKLVNEENFITGGDDGQLCLWGSMKKKPLCLFKHAHGCEEKSKEPNWITAVGTYLNSDIIASGSCNGAVKLWKLGNNCRSIEFMFEVPIVGFVNAISFTSDGSKLIVSTGKEHRYGRWTTVREARNSIIIIPLMRDVI